MLCFEVSALFFVGNQPKLLRCLLSAWRNEIIIDVNETDILKRPGCADWGSEQAEIDLFLAGWRTWPITF